MQSDFEEISFETVGPALEKEVIVNEEESVKHRSISAELTEKWKNIIENTGYSLYDHTRVLNVSTLPEDLKEMVEKEYDIVKRIIFKLDEDIELRLEGCKPVPIRELTAADVGKLVEVRGAVKSFDEERTVVIVKDCWECDAGHLSYSRGPGPETEKCKFPTRQKSARGKPLPCGEHFIRQVFSEQKRQDQFAIRIEEAEEDPSLDPAAIDIQFTGSELVKDVLASIKDNTKNIIVCGIVKLSGSKETGSGMSLYIDGTGFQRVQRHYTSRFDQLVRREIPSHLMRSHVMKLVRSYCPHISGRMDVKTGLMAAAVGTSVKRITAGSKIRGEINALLIGSPGTGKTQMLKFMELVRRDSVYVSGRQATAVGLTAGVDWSEKPIGGGARRRQVYMGAYAQANGAIALVDELHKREKKDLEHLASVMDDNQELIVAQQGVFRKLAVSVGSVHAANPRSNGGMYDKKLGLVEQMDQAFWLYSRYDLIFVLTKDDQRDTKENMRHAIAEMYRTIKSVTEEDKKRSIDEPLTESEIQTLLSAEFYPPEYLQAEIEYLRTLPAPTLEVNSEQWDIMMEFWEKFNSIPIPDALADVFDNRKTNSIVRVAEAIAKLYRSPVVQLEHMEEAIALFHSGINNIIKGGQQSGIAYVRFAEWLSKNALDQCYLCRGKGCNACDGIGGQYIPITFSDCSDYPYQSEAREGWDYLKKIGGLVQIDHSLGGSAYRVTSVVRDIAAGSWSEREDKDIANEALRMLGT